MGLDLIRVDFDVWLHEQTVTRHEEIEILKQLQEHVGQQIDSSQWQAKGDESVRVGPYGAFDVLRQALAWMSGRAWDDVDGEELDEYDELAREAISQEVPKGVEMPNVAHLLDVGDSDTLFLPLAFDRPYEHQEIWIASSPRVLESLQAFAKVLGFDLTTEAETEMKGEQWDPVGTARNVARVIFLFLRDQPNACVAFT